MPTKFSATRSNRHRAGPKPRLTSRMGTRRAITDYFATVRDAKTGEWTGTPTFSALTLALGLTETRMLWRYANGEIKGCDADIEEACKRACLLIEQYHEHRIATLKQVPVGSIFILKNRHWRDQHDMRHDGEVSTVMRVELPRAKRERGAHIQVTPESVEHIEAKDGQ